MADGEPELISRKEDIPEELRGIADLILQPYELSEPIRGAVNLIMKESYNFGRLKGQVEGIRSDNDLYLSHLSRIVRRIEKQLS